jgi:hypothetical protein
VESRKGLDGGSQQSEDGAERQQQALDWFQSQLNWYARNAKKSRWAYTAAQSAAIVLSAVTPVIVVVQSIPVAVRGVPAVIATIALAASNLFGWRENWARHIQTAGALERERLWFDTRTGPYAGSADANARFAQYVAAASAIVTAEYGQWQSELLHRAKANIDREDGSSEP